MDFANQSRHVPSLEQLNMVLFKKTMDPVRARFWIDAKMTKDQIDEVVLVGGSHTYSQSTAAFGGLFWKARK